MHLCLSVVLPIMVWFFFPAPAQATIRTVIDQMDRTITLPDHPQRIVALAPSITEIIFALGQGHRLIGVTRFSNHPARAEALPKVGSYVRLDLERIVALKPDLCIAIKEGNPKAVIDRLESLKIPVYAVNPRNLDTVMKTVRDIGGILGASERAEILIRNMRSRIRRVKSVVAKTVHRPRVFFQIGISPIVSAGTDTLIDELIELAGGKNLAEGRTPYPRFSREQVIGLSPEVFIITSMARQAVFKQVKAEWSHWHDMPAVRDRRIFLVDSDLFDRPTPRLLDGLELLVRLIHPQMYEEAQ